MKWRPDYEIACDEYQKAGKSLIFFSTDFYQFLQCRMFSATCYRNAKALDECKDCLMKAAECHMQNRGLFHAARCFEQVTINTTHMLFCFNISEWDDIKIFFVCHCR